MAVAGTYTWDRRYAMWRWILDEFYNDPKYADIIYQVNVPEDGLGGGVVKKKLFFFPSPVVPAYNNATLVSLVESNGGRNDVVVQSMWAMDNDFAGGAWGFFSSCQAPCPAPAPAPAASVADAAVGGVDGEVSWPLAGATLVEGDSDTSGWYNDDGAGEWFDVWSDDP